jgi:hypothetical protein
VTRSPFATGTRKPTRLHNLVPPRAAAVLMKLWVDPKSEGSKAGALDLNVELHHPARAQLDVGECEEGYSGVLIYGR